MKDDELIWVPTKRKYYIFTWGFYEYKNTIAHLEKNPELKIQDGFNKFSGFLNKLGSISRDSKFKFLFASVCTRDDPITVKQMDFTPET